MKRIVLAILLVCMSAGAWARNEKKTVVFDVDLHCQGCITKIEKNIAFEPGVKDLVCDLDARTVTVVYNPAKTNVEQLQAAFAKINKTATVRTSSEPAEHEQEQDKDKEVDAQTGASMQQ